MVPWNPLYITACKTIYVCPPRHQRGLYSCSPILPSWHGRRVLPSWLYWPNFWNPSENFQICPSIASVLTMRMKSKQFKTKLDIWNISTGLQYTVFFFTHACVQFETTKWNQNGDIDINLNISILQHGTIAKYVFICAFSFSCLSHGCVRAQQELKSNTKNQ